MNELKEYNPKLYVLLTLFFPLLVFMLIIFYFFTTPITAHAEETTQYTYSFTKTNKQIYNDGTWAEESYIVDFTSESEIVGVSNEINTWTNIDFYYFDGDKLNSYISKNCNQIRTLSKSDGTSNSESSVTNYSSIDFASGYCENSNSTNYYSHSTNIKEFSNADSALNYFRTGDISGQLNKTEYVDNDNFVLTGFECDNSIHASWQDIICPEPINKSDVIVYVKPTYFLILESGEDEQEFTGAEAVAIKGDYVFDKPYDDYFANNPYKGRCQLFLTFTPTYNDSANNKIYRGKQITVRLDENGIIQNIDIPESALTPTYTNEFSFKNFTSTSEFHNFGDSYIHCYWTGVDIAQNINYIYSDIKVQLYARTGEGTNISYNWIDYNLNDIVSFNSNRLDFNLTELDSFCREHGYRFYDSTYQWSNEKIRITPYCKTSNSYLYGKSVEINLTKLGGIDSILQSKGDAINDETTGYDNLDEDYFTDHSVIGDLVDDVVNGDNSGLDLDGLTLNFFTMLTSFFKACGQFPSMIATVFFFLPNYFVYMLTITLSVIIIMRILGR